MAKRLLLKTFSGPHLGAEVVLSDGEYTLGRGSQCDLVFEDHAVAEEHLKLKVAGERVQAQPLGDARMLIGGKATDGCTLPPGEYFTIGTTHLAIGFADEQWILKPLPEIKLGDDAAPTARELEQKKAAEAPPPRKSRRKRFVVVTTLLVLFGLGAWGSWVALTPTIQAAIARRDDAGAALQAIIKKFGVGETVKAEKADRGWIVQGHVQDRETVKSLETEFRNHVPGSAIRLWDSETLAQASGEVLAAFRVPVAAAPGRAGEVVFEGRVPDSSQWAKVRERIRHDVPALLTLTDHVLTGTGRSLRDKNGKIVDASKAPAPKVGSAGNTYVLAMPFAQPNESRSTSETAKSDDKTAARISDLKGGDSKSVDAKSEMDARPGDRVASTMKQPVLLPQQSPNQDAAASTVKYVAATPIPNASPSPAAAVTSEKPTPPPMLAYQSVSVGAGSWLRLADGTRVSVGGRIGGGYEVTSISDEAIEARKGETRIVYRLREGT